MSRICIIFCMFFSTTLIVQKINAQNLMNRLPGGMRQMGGGGRGSGTGKDSIQFEKRNFADESAAVRFRYLDSARFRSIDSSIADYFIKVPMDPEYVNLGNNGTAAHSLLYTPFMKAGWDPGFHAFDLFMFTPEETKFMTTNKPYTRLTYLLGSRAEQHIGIMHTQNISADWNAGFEYRLINAPGFYNSQNTNHKNIRVNTNYTSKNKRYNAYFIAIANGIQSSENGGIRSDTFLLNKNPAYNDLFNIPTNLAVEPADAGNFFNVTLNTGNRQNISHFLLRQQYDFGKKDSTITDSTVNRFFLPRFRFEHTIQYSARKYFFLDVQGYGDSAFYKKNYGITIDQPDTVRYTDRWRELINDFSILQFPDAYNPLQFLKLGVSLYNIKGLLTTGNDVFMNLKLHGEYRNRTKDRKWDMLMYGEFYAVGRNSGDYDVQARLRTELGKKWGSLELSGRNVNRTPSYIFNRPTDFPVAINTSLNDENIIQLQGKIDEPRQRLGLSGEYYMVSNYVYLADFKTVQQSSSLFSMLRLGLNKEFRLRKNWKWYLDVYFQTLTGNPPLNVPLIYTRNRFAYEGSVFLNLALSTGFDIRYHSPYKSPNYSPVLGQFFYQNNEQLAIRPDIAAYVNFRIRNFTGFTRLENLNTLSFVNGFGFKNNNLETPLYPYPGLLFRFGFVWDLVN
jgi:hypothetical protein